MKALITRVYVAALIVGLQGCSSSDRHDWGEDTPNFTPAERLSNVDGRYDHWQAIGRVEVERGMTCSGTLIDTGTDDVSTQPAYVLTSGHCTHPEVGNNEVIDDLPASGVVRFNFFHDTRSQSKAYPVSRINRSTLRGQDLSIIELSATLGQLIMDGIRPLPLAKQPLMPGNDILIVGAPVGGYIQRMACPQDHSASIIEGPWRWVGQSSNRCLDVVSGLSGSPLLSRYSNTIVGVLGTTTQGSDRSRCARGSPCEVLAGQVEKRPDTNYASTTEGLVGCFTQGRFTPGLGGCSLGAAWSFPISTVSSGYAKVERDEHGQIRPWQWHQSFTLNAPYYRYRFTRSLNECQAFDGYSSPQSARPDAENHLSRELREGAGLYFLCLLGQKSPTDVPRQWEGRTPRVYWRWLLEAPSPLAPGYKVDWVNGDDFDIRVFPATPDLAPDQFRYKNGLAQNIDCDSEQDYQPVTASTGVFHVSVTQGQQTVCLKGADVVGNSGTTVTFKVP
ncbi:trypsin-like peptidase domain-containing protein [Pseudomonas koreensis]|uniref:trypsin-like serine peptidase n=1 Tax=Pseudomonas koreensis TaxID=198620 RepID=UPI0021C67C83|nr:trypsin-like peptidase domain-containing protein [Pseudomonas koreensis]MCU0074810.1 trypsin-like peptidase domain-containing protein [Pseudomonas koreensis]